MIEQQLKNYQKKHRCTLLGVGPVSVNCVDATVELANEFEIPLMLIASRRQIDSEEFGGGYVNGWTTEEFSKYVIDSDKKGRVFLARDHGGPWQNTKEIEEGLSLRRAMESAKKSYEADIDAGFQILHIDPSLDMHSEPSTDEVLDRVFELYEYCWSYSQQCGKEIIFEIGTEEQSGSTNTQEELDYILVTVERFCLENRLPRPTFVVIQTGTRVMESRNIGSFDAPFRVIDEIPAEIQIPKMVEICQQHDILIKQHNTDYLSDEALRWHPRLGIHSANVAPEFGIVETRALLDLLERHRLTKLAENFLELAYGSGKWEKWMLPNTKASYRDRAVIAGHYVFATDECQELKSEATSILRRQGVDLEDSLKDNVKQCLFRYLRNFRLLRDA